MENKSLKRLEYSRSLCYNQTTKAVRILKRLLHQKSIRHPKVGSLFFFFGLTTRSLTSARLSTAYFRHQIHSCKFMLLVSPVDFRHFGCYNKPTEILGIERRFYEKAHCKYHYGQQNIILSAAPASFAFIGAVLCALYPLRDYRYD